MKLEFLWNLQVGATFRTKWFKSCPESQTRNIITTISFSWCVIIILARIDFEHIPISTILNYINLEIG